MSLRDFTHPDDVADNQTQLRRALDGEIGSYQFEKRYLHKDGHVVWGRVSASLVRDQDCKPAYFVTHLEDITPRKLLEQERAKQAEQLQAVMEAVPDPISVYDTDGRIVLANTAYYKLVARLLQETPPGETVRHRVQQLGGFYTRDGTLLKEDEWAQTRALRGEVLASSDAVEILLHSPAGDPLSFSMTAAPLRDPEGHITGAVAMSRDITAYKQLEGERAEAHARELAAQQVAEQISAFLATAGHDIRSPLTVAAARVQLAERVAKRLAAVLDVPLPTLTVTAEPPKALADEAVESLQRARAGMETLRRLVNILFDVTRAQSQKLVLELAAMDLKELVQETVAAQQTATHGHRALLVTVPDHQVWVEGEADRLSEVLTNFLTNAVKYSPVDQPVTVKLEVVDHQAVVRVADHGPGIPTAEQGRIWDMFYRSPSVQVEPGNRTANGSLGLGLSICKQLIELHPGGRIGVESTVGEGSTFWFELPLASSS
jgi:signal transduction histidine kinase